MSKPSVYAIRSWLWVVAALAGAALFMTADAQARVSASAVPASVKPSSGDPVGPPGDLARRVEIPGGRKLYLECRGSGGPTVILISGWGNAGNIWSLLKYPGVISFNPGVKGPAVFPGVARLTRVCTYDRPNTYRRPECPGPASRCQPGRSDPVRQPQGAARAVSDLHALLRAADIPGPYVLVGHSYGGLIARLYASTHPRQVAGLVLVDAASEFVREVSTPEQFAGIAAGGLETIPGLDPPAELLDLVRSYDQMVRAKAARPLRPTLPLVVLSAGLANRVPPELLAEGSPDTLTTARIWNRAQDLLGAIVPYAQHVIARRSHHYIELAQPKLVIDSVRRELRMLGAVAVRCRGGPSLCRARVSLAGGASHKKVVVGLPDTDLRLVSVRANRSSLRGAYGLFGNRLRAGGSEYVFRLNAAQSIPRGSDLLLEFRALGG